MIVLRHRNNAAPPYHHPEAPAFGFRHVHASRHGGNSTEGAAGGYTYKALLRSHSVAA
jgi:hypothetical protein